MQTIYMYKYIYIQIYLYIFFKPPPLICTNYPMFLYSQSMLYRRSIPPDRPDGGTLGTSWYDPQCIPGVGSEMLNMLSQASKNPHTHTFIQTYMFIHICIQQFYVVSGYCHAAVILYIAAILYYRYTLLILQLYPTELQ